MGINNFFNTLVKTKICPKTLLTNIKLNCNYLYIDFNSIIHLMVDKVEYDLNYYLYSILINDKDDQSIKIEKEYNISNINNLEEFNGYFSKIK